MKKALFIAVIYLIIQLAMFFVFSTIGMLFTNTMDSSVYVKNTTYYYWTLGIALIFTNVLLIMIIYFLVSKECEHPFGSYLTIPRSRDFVFSFLTFVFVIFVVNGLSEFTHLRDTHKEVIDGMMHNGLCLFDIVVVGSIANEFCFRRGILGSLLKSPRFHRYALVLSAVFFAVMQFNPGAMLAAFILGMFLGWLYIRTHSLILPIVFEVLNNLLAVVLGLIYGKNTTLVDFFPHEWVFYAALAFCCIASIVFWRLMDKKMHRSCVVEELQK